MTKHTDLDATAAHVKALGRILDAHTAEYIVRACNSHEDLLKRLNKAICPYCQGPCGKCNPDQYHCSWCDETRAAIAKATG